MKNKKLEPERRENFGERREFEKRPYTGNRENVDQPQGTYHYRSAQNQRPKQKFVEKVEDTKK